MDLRQPTYFREPDYSAELRTAVRAFVERHSTESERRSLGMGATFNPEFSRLLAAEGWVGMSISEQYGGTNRPAVYRWIVTEELLATGAPVGAHWIAERQTGPQLTAFGSEAMKEEFLPAIAAGELFVSIGMSEPDAGSDLASVRTRADKVPGGWKINGRKIWTSGALRNHVILALCRSDPHAGSKHEGLSQFVIACDTPGVSITPVRSMEGGESFTEVVFDDAFVPDDRIVGEAGEGWRQVTAELVAERAGPDRYMSAFRLFEALLAADPESAQRHITEFAGALATLSRLRAVSFSVAAMSDQGADVRHLVPIVKDLGTILEQQMVSLARYTFADSTEVANDTELAQWLLKATHSAPSFTLRGGSTQVLRNLVARNL